MRTSWTSKFRNDSPITDVLTSYRKLQEFKKDGERKVSPDVLQTRYDFYHNKRFYKLGEICKKRE